MNHEIKICSATAVTNGRLIFNLGSAILTCIFLLTACQMPTLAVDQSRLKRTRVMPDDVARDIVAKYEDREWVENPYFFAQVNYLRSSDLRTDRIEYNVKKYVGYRKMRLNATFRNECVNIFPHYNPAQTNPLEKYDPNSLTITYYSKKTICTGFMEERDELVDALLALGAQLAR